MKPKLPFHFRIWPDYGFLHFRVSIWPTKKAMYRATTFQQPQNFEAICCGGDVFDVPAKGPERFTGCIGHLHFYFSWFKAGILAHELLHAVYTYFQWRSCHAPPKWNATPPGLCSDEEEAHCWVMGELYRQVCVSYEQAREYRPKKKIKVWFGRPRRSAYNYSAESTARTVPRGGEPAFQRLR